VARCEGAHRTSRSFPALLLATGANVPEPYTPDSNTPRSNHAYVASCFPWKGFGPAAVGGMLAAELRQNFSERKTGGILRS